MRTTQGVQILKARSVFGREGQSRLQCSHRRSVNRPEGRRATGNRTINNQRVQARFGIEIAAMAKTDMK